MNSASELRISSDFDVMLTVPASSLTAALAKVTIRSDLSLLFTAWHRPSRLLHLGEFPVSFSSISLGYTDRNRYLEFYNRFAGRTALLAYAAENGIPVTQTAAKPWSTGQTS